MASLKPAAGTFTRLPPGLNRSLPVIADAKRARGILLLGMSWNVGMGERSSHKLAKHEVLMFGLTTCKQEFKQHRKGTRSLVE